LDDRQSFGCEVTRRLAISTARLLDLQGLGCLKIRYGEGLRSEGGEEESVEDGRLDLHELRRKRWMSVKYVSVCV
jgi:hypothetical protein